jgi:hypothetical protein
MANAQISAVRALLQDESINWKNLVQTLALTLGAEQGDQSPAKTKAQKAKFNPDQADYPKNPAFIGRIVPKDFTKALTLQEYKRAQARHNAKDSPQESQPPHKALTWQDHRRRRSARQGAGTL